MQTKRLPILVIFVFLLVACSTTALPTPTHPVEPPSATSPKSVATQIRHTATSGYKANTTPKATIEPTASLFLLSELGEYFPGKRKFAFFDVSRDRPVEITVWYPAIRPEGFNRTVITEGEPQREGAPYPVILSSTKVAEIFAPFIVSHGFAMVSVDKIDTYEVWNPEMINQPLDILYALEMAASTPLEGLDGMLDTDRAGTMGYSFDGYNSLALSGARIDPGHYIGLCADQNAIIKNLGEQFVRYYQCVPSKSWSTWTAVAGEAITNSPDGLWQPMTDSRIKAVLPMAGEGWLLFGEKGLAAVDRPTMILVASRDVLHKENTIIFEHLGTPEKYLITFLRKDHYMVYDSSSVRRMAHFAIAFFGYYLQGNQELAYYFSEEFVSQFKDLAYGMPTD